MLVPDLCDALVGRHCESGLNVCARRAEDVCVVLALMCLSKSDAEARDRSEVGVSGGSPEVCRVYRP